MTNDNTLSLAINPSTCTALEVYKPIIIDPPARPQGADDNGRLAQLIADAISCYKRGRDLRLELGNILLEIHALKAKPGNGSFMRTLREDMKIPYTTARDYMCEAFLARHHNGIRSYQLPPDLAPDPEVIPIDPNAGSLDEVQLTVADERAKVVEAMSKQKPIDDLPRVFNWKFTDLPMSVAAQLKAAKSTLGNERASLILIRAAKEVSNELLAA